MRLDFRREYQVRLPLPLAQLYSRAYNDKSPRGRHDNTFYLFEALIKLAAAPLIVAYLEEVERGAARSANLDRLLTQLALPSLGQWVNMFRDLARWFGARPDAASHPLGGLWKQIDERRRDWAGLIALHRRIKNGPDGPPAGDESCSILEVINALVPYRNGVLGHGGPRFESFYETEMGPLLFPAVNDLLAEGALNVLGPKESRLVHIAEVRVTGDDRVELGLRELVGLRAERAAAHVLTGEQAKGLLPGRVAVLWPGRAAPLVVYPLLLFREGELADELLYLNRDRDGKQVEYLSYTTGRPERERSTIADLAALLGRVTRRTVSDSDLERLADESRAETTGEVVAAASAAGGQRRGDFEILAEIGRGGMGVVFLARQLSLGRLVALKMLPTELSGDEVALARFRREMRAISRCEHPHIVKVLTSGVFPDGQLYYAMEYVPGADLDRVWRELAGAQAGDSATQVGGTTWNLAVRAASEKLRAELSKRLSGDATRSEASALTMTSPARVPPVVLPPLPAIPSADEQPGEYARRVAVLMRDAALALQAVHEQQIVHRDVKPANLMLTPDGARVVLMDFGLAKGLGDGLTKTTSAGFLGSWRYAAPEQLAAATLTIGPPADVRALGVTLWELLTRRRLFADASDEKQLAQMIHEMNVPRLRTVDPALDRDLEAIVARATERRVADRIQSAREMADYLQLYLDGKPLPIRAPGLGELSQRWVREHRGVVATAAAALAAIVLVTVFAFLSINAAKDDAVTAKNQAVEAKNKAVEAEGKALKLADEKTALAAEKSTLATEKSNLAAEKTQLAATNLELAEKESAAKKKVQSQAAELKRQLAASLFERGYAEYVQGHIPQGMAILGQAFDTAAADDPLRLSIQNMLGHWLATMPLYLPHDEAVTAVAYSPDGASILSGSQDASARVWQARTGQPFALPLRHDWPVEAVAFDRTGTKACTGFGDPIWGYEGGVQIWNARTGASLQALPQSAQVLALVASPVDDTLLVGLDPPNDERESLGIWSPQGGQRETAKGKQVSAAVAISPDGATALTGGDAKVAQLWNVKTGEPIGAPMPHQEAVTAVAFSPNGQLVLTGSADKTARLWNAKTGLPASEPLPHESGVTSVAFSADGGLAATGATNGLARLWTTRDGKAAGTPLPQGKVVNAVAFSPDGARLAVAAGTTVRVWELPAPRVASVTMEHEGLVRRLAFSPGGEQLLTASNDGFARVWRIDSSDPIGGPILHRDAGVDPTRFGWMKEMIFCGDGATLLTTASDDKSARLWNARTGSVLNKGFTQQETLSGVALSRDDKRVVTGGFDLATYEGLAQVWDAREGNAVGKALKVGKGVVSVALSADDKTVMTAHRDNVVRFWNSSTGEPLGEPLKFAEEVTCALYSPDGASLFIGRLGVGQFYDAATRRPKSGPITHVPINAVRYNPDSSGVLSHVGIGETIQRDGYIYILDARTGKLGATIQVEGNIDTAEYSADGKMIVGGGGPRLGGSGFARLWDAHTGKPLGPPLVHANRVSTATFSPREPILVTGSSHGAQFWDVLTSKPLGPPLATHQIVTVASFSRDGSRVAIGGIVEKAPAGQVYRVPSPVPAELVPLIIATHGGLRLASDGRLERLGSVEEMAAWKRLETEGAAWLAARAKIDAERRERWHRVQAEDAEAHESWFAAHFHWDWLARQNPGDEEVRNHRDRAAGKLPTSPAAP